MKEAFVACVFVFLLAMSCDNQPFTLQPLGVVRVENLTSGAKAQYKYKNQRIAAFSRMVGADTVLDMRFHYAADGLERIVIDSTAEQYGLLKVTRVSPQTTTDSLFLITPTLTSLLQARFFSYDDQGRLAGIDAFTQGAEGLIINQYVPTWEGANISTLKRTEIDPAAETTETVLSIGYDTRPGVYSSDVDYVYTIPPDELYWLSANNPINFKRDTLNQVSYKYNYNAMGYPTHIRTDRGQVIGHTYTELR